MSDSHTEKMMSFLEDCRFRCYKVRSYTLVVRKVKGGRVMIAFFVNYSTVAFPLHLPTLKRQQSLGAVANSLGKNSFFPLPLDVRRCVAPTGEEVDARQRGVN